MMVIRESGTVVSSVALDGPGTYQAPLRCFTGANGELPPIVQGEEMVFLMAGKKCQGLVLRSDPTATFEGMTEGASLMSTDKTHANTTGLDSTITKAAVGEFAAFTGLTAGFSPSDVVSEVVSASCGQPEARIDRFDDERQVLWCSYFAGEGDAPVLICFLIWMMFCSLLLQLLLRFQWTVMTVVHCVV